MTCHWDKTYLQPRHNMQICPYNRTCTLKIFKVGWVKIIHQFKLRPMFGKSKQPIVNNVTQFDGQTSWELNAKSSSIAEKILKWLEDVGRCCLNHFWKAAILSGIFFAVCFCWNVHWFSCSLGTIHRGLLLYPDMNRPWQLKQEARSAS